MQWETDVHASWFELLAFVLSCVLKTLCALVVLWVFYGATYLPGCDAASIARTHDPILAMLPVSILAAMTGIFSAYGSNWTPVQRKYESIDAVFSLLLGSLVVVGVVKNLGSMSSIMSFASWLFGLLVIVDLLLNWIGRLVRWTQIRRAQRAAASPSAP